MDRWQIWLHGSRFKIVKSKFIIIDQFQKEIHKKKYRLLELTMKEKILKNETGQRPHINISTVRENLGSDHL